MLLILAPLWCTQSYPFFYLLTGIASATLSIFYLSIFYLFLSLSPSHQSPIYFIFLINIFLLYEKCSSDSTSPSTYYLISFLSFIGNHLLCKRFVCTHCLQFLFFPHSWKLCNQHVVPTPPLKPLPYKAKDVYVAKLNCYFTQHNWLSKVYLDMGGQILFHFLHLVFRIPQFPSFPPGLKIK